MLVGVGTDILFIDSTHVSKIGSDVNRLIFDILPALPRGVVVHFHDIFFPFEYPLEWLYEGRAWNEAYLLRAFLSYNKSFKILFWNSYLQAKQLDALNAAYPAMAVGGSSIWIKKV